MNDSSKLSFARRFTSRLWLLTATAICLFPWLATTPVYAGDTAPLFEHSTPLEVTINAPFDKIMRERSEEDEYEGALLYTDANGESVELTVNVRVRGKFRARHDICDFAPLRLNFKKKQVKDTLFDGQDKVKLVTHCENKGAAHEQNVLKEYLAYRFLQTLSDLSFQTRLLRVTYVDSESDRSRTKYGFIVEHEDELAKRVDADIAMVKSAEIDHLDAQQTNLFAVHAYFIGNTDFSAQLGPKEEFCCHNAVLLTREPGVYLPVPYDFDLSGIVDAPYAAPNPKYGIKRVTDRLYRGLCRDIDSLPATLQMFTDNREEFESMIDNLDGLMRRTRVDVKNFVDDFYKDIRDEASVERKLIETCSS